MIRPNAKKIIEYLKASNLNDFAVSYGKDDTKYEVVDLSTGKPIDPDSFLPELRRLVKPPRKPEEKISLQEIKDFVQPPETILRELKILKPSEPKPVPANIPHVPINKTSPTKTEEVSI